MKHRAYQFVSHWRIAGSRLIVVDVLLHDEHWTQWWPGLQRVQLLNEATGVGAQFRCVWRSVSGYQLRLLITITRYRAGEHIAFTSSGDLEGTGEFIFRDDGQGTNITINWNVSTTKRWMNVLAPLLHPLFIKNHDRLMAAGERGLQ